MWCVEFFLFYLYRSLVDLDWRILRQCQWWIKGGCVCVCVCVCVCGFLYMRLCARERAFDRVCPCVREYEYQQMRVCVCAGVYMWALVCLTVRER